MSAVPAFKEGPAHWHWPVEAALEALGWDGYSRGTGAWRRLRCPFHASAGRRPTAGVSTQANAFACHYDACGAKGNSVTLVMQQRGLTEPQAVAWLMSVLGPPGDLAIHRAKTRNQV